MLLCRGRSVPAQRLAGHIVFSMQSPHSCSASKDMQILVWVHREVFCLLACCRRARLTRQHNVSLLMQCDQAPLSLQARGAGHDTAVIACTGLRPPIQACLQALCPGSRPLANPLQPTGPRYDWELLSHLAGSFQRTWMITCAGEQQAPQSLSRQAVMYSLQ